MITLYDRKARKNCATWFAREIARALEREMARGYHTDAEIVGELEMLKQRFVEGIYHQWWNGMSHAEQVKVVKALRAEEMPPRP